jgi:hypothetical protein
MPYLLIPFLICIGLLWWWWIVIRFKRTVENVPTSKVQGVFIGLNEVKGDIESENPFKTYLSEISAVWYKWSVEERWRRTETYTDSKGKSRTRTRSGWKTVRDGNDEQPFFLRDDTGSLLVIPNGAKIEAPTTFSRTCRRSDPLYYEKGPDHSIANSTHERKFHEEALQPEDPIYILGPARLREEVAEPMIAEDENERYYFISTKSEQQIIRGRGILSVFLLVFAFIAALAVPMTLFGVMENMKPLETIQVHPLSVVIAAVSFWMVWGFLYLMMLFNGLVRVRNRQERALSLIDIQLKRRHDLIPRLVECVKGAASHEREVQETVAQARTAATGWQKPRDDRDGALRKDRAVMGRLFALAEDYPDLHADANFQLFFNQLVDTEDRIALARAYYNDSLLSLKNRLKTFPDVLVAKIFRFNPGTPLPSLTEKASEAPEISLYDDDQA